MIGERTENRWTRRRVIASAAVFCGGGAAVGEETSMELATDWVFVADTVMGGVSRGQVSRESLAGRQAARLTGTVSLENDGGFVQVATSLGSQDAPLDARGWTGIEVDVLGNGETYELRLRTDELTRPWQSYRRPFVAPPEWVTVRAPFAELEAHRTDRSFDAARLRRLGVVAIGREFEADVAVGDVRLYR